MRVTRSDIGAFPTRSLAKLLAAEYRGDQEDGDGYCGDDSTVSKGITHGIHLYC